MSASALLAAAQSVLPKRETRRTASPSALHEPKPLAAAPAKKRAADTTPPPPKRTARSAEPDTPAPAESAPPVAPKPAPASRMPDDDAPVSVVGARQRLAELQAGLDAMRAAPVTMSPPRDAQPAPARASPPPVAPKPAPVSRMPADENERLAEFRAALDARVAARAALPGPIPVRTCHEEELPREERRALRVCSVGFRDACKGKARMTCRLCKLRMCYDCYAQCKYTHTVTCRACAVMTDLDGKNGKSPALCEDCYEWVCPELADEKLRIVMVEQERDDGKSKVDVCALCVECCKERFD